jgi:hypothetical protein
MQIFFAKFWLFSSFLVCYFAFTHDYATNYQEFAMKKFFLPALVSLFILWSLSGCALAMQEFQRDITKFSRGKYRVIQYSGGKVIGTWEFFGIVNRHEYTNKLFFFVGDTLVELSGDLQVYRLGN